MVRPEEVTAPASFHAPHRNRAPHLDWLYARRADGTAVKNTQTLFACSEREACEAIALNYGSVSFIDYSIGRVLAELRALGIENDTVVVFTSDHADFMGDHQLLLKGPLHYRGLTRVPFIWADAARPGRRRSQALTQTIDIAATILERAGVEPWNGMQGKSLLPLIDGEADRVRETLVIEDEGQRCYLGLAGRVRMRSLLDGRHRISIYDGVHWGELYDLANDPEELINLWDEPAARTLRAEMTEKLSRAMIELSETSPYATQIA